MRRTRKGGQIALPYLFGNFIVTRCLEKRLLDPIDDELHGKGGQDHAEQP